MISEKQLAEAYDECRKIALGHYENFPVGSILIPKELRQHFFALYAFMRTADDFADLPIRPAQERLKLLADWREKLKEAVSGSEPEDPIFVALQNTIAVCKLSIEPLYKLIEAFEFDAKGEVHFQTFDDLRWYTSRSAEPVGVLVLGLFGYHDQQRIKLSNDICTGLQLLNFIQDIREDLENHRYYYPQDDSQIFGFEPTQSPVNSERLSLASLFQLDRVESLIEKGSPLAESVSGRLRYELRAVIRAAQKMIAKIRRRGGNTYALRPKLSKLDHSVVLVQSVLFRVK
jgi:squalene synthase HpnC